MDVSAKPEQCPAALSLRVLARVGMSDRSVVEDLMFLHAWDAGLAPLLSGALRVRQIRRANPAAAAREDSHGARQAAGRSLQAHACGLPAPTG